MLCTPMQRRTTHSPWIQVTPPPLPPFNLDAAAVGPESSSGIFSVYSGVPVNSEGALT